MLNAWNDVTAHITRNYEIARRGDEWVQLGWTFPIGEGKPLQQVLEVTRTETLGSTFVRLVARVAGRRAFDANAALRLNFSLVVGHLAHHGETVLLIHYVSLPASAAELDRAMELVPHEAARLRHGLAQCHVPTMPLDVYAD